MLLMSDLDFWRMFIHAVTAGKRHEPASAQKFIKPIPAFLPARFRFLRSVFIISLPFCTCLRLTTSKNLRILFTTVSEEVNDYISVFEGDER